MRIGLIDIEPKIFNTALMQIACYHKQRGDTVEWWTSLTDRQFDHIYCSSIFDYTDKSEVPERTICGGTGFDVSSRLSQAIENSQLDYSIYPKCDRSFIWFSRGCNRNCPWCVVPVKEGKIHPVRRKALNPKGKYIVVMDNNFFANPEWQNAIWFLEDYPVDIQGVDARTLTEEKCKALNGLRRWKKKQIKIAWDDPNINLEPKLRKITQYIKPYKLMCYVLIGFSSSKAQDLHRVETLRRLGIDPFVMPYDKNDLYQRSFARWVNDKAIFNKNNPRINWEDYKQRVSRQEAAGCGWKS